MTVQKQTRHAQVELNVRVPRDAAGDLPAGVREVLAGIEGVRGVAALDVRGMRPTAFDLRVDAAAALELAVEGDVDAVRDHLRDGFGVERVDALVLDVG